MSQGTPINKLSGNNMNDEDSRLVDSILNDLNSGSDGGGMPPGSMPQAGGPPQQITPEQHKAMLAQRQQQMMQQQMMMQQQQAMMQQQQAQKKEETSGPESILEKIQSEWKTILIVFVLAACINMGAVDNLFKTDTLGFFVDEGGNLTIQAIMVKALAVAISFFVIHTFVPL